MNTNAPIVKSNQSKTWSQMDQKARVLDYLQIFGKINPIQSWQTLGVYRLSSVIHKLRKQGKTQGFTIKTNDVEAFNRFGESVTFAEYELSTTNPQNRTK